MQYEVFFKVRAYVEADSTHSATELAKKLATEIVEADNQIKEAILQRVVSE